MEGNKNGGSSQIRLVRAQAAMAGRQNRPHLFENFRLGRCPSIGEIGYDVFALSPPPLEQPKSVNIYFLSYLLGQKQ